jgi:chain length determinant protein (polysaccharide antigen chain regulator)
MLYWLAIAFEEIGVKEQQLRSIRNRNEIYLIKLLRTFWQHKLLILITTFISLFLAFFYISLSTPIYEATAYISPPTRGDIAALNYGRVNSKNKLLSLYKVKDVYKIFINNLQNDSTKSEFFYRVFLPSLLKNKDQTHSQGEFFTLFSNSLSIKAAKVIPANYPANYIVSMRGPFPEQDADWLKKYIDLAKQKALKQVLAKAKYQYNGIVNTLQNKIDAIKEIASNQRLFQIQQLKEAIQIAKAVLGEGAASSSSTGIKTDVLAISNPSAMLYLRGSAVLKAELDNLMSRGSLDAFAPSNLKLREKQGQLNFYKKIVIDPENVILFKLDGEIAKPVEIIAPRKKLILAIACCLGLFLGTLLAIIRNF